MCFAKQMRQTHLFLNQLDGFRKIVKMTTMTGFDKFNNGFSKGFLNTSEVFKRSMMSISSLASHRLLNIMITK